MLSKRFCSTKTLMLAFLRIGSIDVIDQMGRLVLVKEITNARSIINFELINQASSIYFLMLKDRTNVVVASEKRFVQENTTTTTTTTVKNNSNNNNNFRN